MKLSGAVRMQTQVTFRMSEARTGTTRTGTTAPTALPIP